MAKIKHRVGIVVSQQDVWAAITDTKKLCGWWSSSADGSSELDGTLNLKFEGLTTLSFLVIQRKEDHLLHLKNIDGPGAWNGSDLEFRLEPGEGQIFLVLEHNSDEASEADFQFFMTKWPIFLVSLKSYAETGKGRPFPDDIKIQADL